MAPFSLSKPWAAFRHALAWGAGHSTGVVVLALIAIGLKDLAHVEAMSSWAEFLVGVALLVVGALAVRTAFGLELHTHEHRHDGAAEHIVISICMCAAPATTVATSMPPRAWACCMDWRGPVTCWL